MAIATLTSQAQAAATAKVSWDANTEADLAGYKIYWGTVPGNYTNSISVGKVTTLTLSNLVAGVTYYIAATAYNSSGLESDFSNEIVWKKPLPPKNVRFGYLTPHDTSDIPAIADNRKRRWPI